MGSKHHIFPTIWPTLEDFVIQNYTPHRLAQGYRTSKQFGFSAQTRSYFWPLAKNPRRWTCRNTGFGPQNGRYSIPSVPTSPTFRASDKCTNVGASKTLKQITTMSEFYPPRIYWVQLFMPLGKDIYFACLRNVDTLWNSSFFLNSEIILSLLAGQLCGESCLNEQNWK